MGNYWLDLDKREAERNSRGIQLLTTSCHTLEMTDHWPKSTKPFDFNSTEKHKDYIVFKSSYGCAIQFSDIGGPCPEFEPIDFTNCGPIPEPTVVPPPIIKNGEWING